MEIDLRARSDSPTRHAMAVTAAVLVLTAAVLSMRGGGVADAAVDQERSAQQELGPFLYGRDCAGCHGADGQGSPRGVPLTDAGEAGAHYMLATGRMPISDPDQLPRRGPSPYSDAEIDALTRHVASFGDGPALPDVDWRDGDVGRGGTLYRLHCGACHSATAVGGALAFDREAPPLMRSEPSVVQAAVVAGPGAMPDFAPLGFSDEELASLVAYVQEIRSPNDEGGWPIFRHGRADEALVAWLVAVPSLLLAAGWVARRVR